MSTVRHTGTSHWDGTRMIPNLQEAANREAALEYTTTGKSFPSSDPQCSQYFLSYDDSPCTESNQSFAIRSALKKVRGEGDFVPNTPDTYGIQRDTSLTQEWNGQTLGYKYVPVVDSPVWRDSYLRNLSTTLSDDQWPKYMGKTGKGLEGYKKCEAMCTNDSRCTAFHSMSPVGKKINPVNGDLSEDDPNTEFACVLFGNTGNMEGAAYTPATRNHRQRKTGGQCWVKRCQDDLKHVFVPGSIQMEPNGTYESVYSWSRDGRQGFAGRTRSSGGQDYNRWIVMDDPNKNYTDYLFGEANKTNETRRTSYPICCNYDPTFGNWPLRKIGETTPPPTAAPAPVDCQVGGWSDWDNCSASCGGGTQSRSRTVTRQPANGGASCPSLSETRSCNEAACTTSAPTTQTSYVYYRSKGSSTWYRWNVSLEQAKSYCSRYSPYYDFAYGPYGITSPNVPSNYNNVCGATQTTAPAPVDCEVTGWSNWTNCSASCGGGTQTRSRSVSKQPSNGGQGCPSLSESQSCNEQACPIDCQVSGWTAWGDCSATCGGGTQSRNRSVIQQPEGGGQGCPSLNETRNCNTQACVTATPSYVYYRQKGSRTWYRWNVSLDQAKSYCSRYSPYYDFAYGPYGFTAPNVPSNFNDICGATPTTTPPCQPKADLDNSERVDLQDILLAINDWGCTGSACRGDANCDDKVDNNDLTYIQSRWS